MLLTLYKLSNKEFKLVAKFFKENPTRKVCYLGVDKEATIHVRRTDPNVRKFLKRK